MKRDRLSEGSFNISSLSLPARMKGIRRSPVLGVARHRPWDRAAPAALTRLHNEMGGFPSLILFADPRPLWCNRRLGAIEK